MLAAGSLFGGRGAERTRAESECLGPSPRISWQRAVDPMCLLLLSLSLSIVTNIHITITIIIIIIMIITITTIVITIIAVLLGDASYADRGPCVARRNPEASD